MYLGIKGQASEQNTANPDETLLTQKQSSKNVREKVENEEKIISVIRENSVSLDEPDEIETSSQSSGMSDSMSSKDKNKIDSKKAEEIDLIDGNLAVPSVSDAEKDEAL